MITRQPETSEGEVLVTFTVPASADDTAASLVGEFNEWSHEHTPMERDSDGNYSVTIGLLAGRTYRFRYLFADGRWENDDAADEYASNQYGGTDSVVNLTSTTAPESHDIPEE